MAWDDVKIDKLRRGERVIVGDEWLETHRDHPIMRVIYTARNRKRCGVHDAYVAWATPEAAPPDMTYDDELFAYATI